MAKFDCLFPAVGGRMRVPAQQPEFSLATILPPIVSREPRDPCLDRTKLTACECQVSDSKNSLENVLSIFRRRSTSGIIYVLRTDNDACSRARCPWRYSG